MKRQTANRAHRQQSEEEAKHEVKDLDNPIDHCHRKTKEGLAPGLKRRRCRIGNHVERKYDERRAGHRHQRHQCHTAHERGEIEQARQEFEAAHADGFASLPQDVNWLDALSAAANAAPGSK